MKEIVKSRLQLISKEVIIKQMGYNNKKRGLESLEKFLSMDIYNWIYHSGHYDFKYNSLGFLKEICKIVSIPDIELEKELQRNKTLYDELQKIKYCHIFINTNFKRTSQSIWRLMAYQKIRRISIDKEKLLFKTDEDIFKTVSLLIINHYKSSEGKLTLWGEIVDYQYYHNDNKYYNFDINGNRP